MRALIVKTSSLGDVLNTLPALTDAATYLPDITFDWVIEQAFAEIPSWHPQVGKTIPLAWRQWRSNVTQAWKTKAPQKFYADLRQKSYDCIIDAQGLVKSSLITLLARGTRYGYDRRSAWEPLACFAYQQQYYVNPSQHAIARIRQLFAHSLGYSLPTTLPNCTINPPRARHNSYLSPYCVLLHGSARLEKCWPEPYWANLIQILSCAGYQILIPWGNAIEFERAKRLVKDQSRTTLLPACSLSTLADILASSQFNIAVDTGLGHLAAALDSPTLSLYGPTQPSLNGTLGKHQYHLKKNRMKDISVEEAHHFLKKINFL